MRTIAVLVPAVALCLGACGSDQAPPERPLNDDPALTAALNEQIMVDPDLTSQNRANAVASLPSTDGSVPALDVTPEAAGRARADALTLVGGPGAMRTAPAARRLSGALPADSPLIAAARAAHAPGTRDCAAKAQYTAAWAARLPEPFPVYPRGAVQEAAGTDSDGCALRVINFQTPVAVGEVMDFYFTRAAKAGFSVQHVTQDGFDVLGGVKGAASYTVYARKLANGATEVDLVTSG